MSERKHVDHAVPRLQETEVIETIADIAPDAEERKHHTLRHAGGSGRIVDDGDVFRHVMEIIHILLCETVWVSLAEEGVYIVSGFREPLAAGKRHSELTYVDGTGQTGKKSLVEGLPYRGVHKKEFRVAMVHKVMDRIGLELMKDRHRHHSRREAGKEHDCPVGGVPAAYSHLVALTDTGLLEYYVKLLYPEGHILVLVVHPSHIGEGHAVPVIEYRFTYQCIKRSFIVVFCGFHNMSCVFILSGYCQLQDPAIRRASP